ncbi:MAG: sel1 repeat family protein [Gammaproteobacteria bacterium]|nr:sel1 repeat family protein [Gammaproteobacteria bacterium]MCI0590029.1 sel1 repeat family protein [Gammaproteobacteria bacterium]
MRKVFLGLAFLLSPLTLLAADFNDGAAAYSMGDYARAYQTMQALAEGSEHEYAEYYLAVMYANGQGVEQNFEEAAKWYRKAAEHGIPQAQYRLANLYVDGKGVPQDFEMAYAWYSTAAHQGHSGAAESVPAAEAMLSPDELKAAKKLSAEYIAKYGTQDKKEP